MSEAVPAEFAVGEPLSERMRRLREQSGMTRSELAERTGLSRPTIWAWERGKAQPRQSNLRTVAQALGISEQELTGPGRMSMLPGEVELVSPALWRSGRLPTGLGNPQRLKILIYAAKLGIAALAGVRAQNVKISIEL